MLYLSVVALFIGPLLYRWLRRGGLLARAVDRFLVAILVVLIVFLLVPEMFVHMGFTAIALIAAGYLIPGLLERLVQRAAPTFHTISLLLALTGLVLHALLEGAALVGSGGESGFSIVVILHRLGVGLVLWFMVQPVFGGRVAWSVLTLVAVATLAGAWLSEPLLSRGHDHGVHVLQALVIGTIIHSLVHRGHAHANSSAHTQSGSN